MHWPSQQPQWFKPHLVAEWVERYGARLDDYRLPQGQAARQALAAQVGADGRTLLNAIYSADAPDWLRQLPAVETLRQIWLQQYEAVGSSEPMRWRELADQPPAAHHINSPTIRKHAMAASVPRNGWAIRRI